MQSKAKTVRQYLAELPQDRRKAISAVRDVIRENLPKGYEAARQPTTAMRKTAKKRSAKRA
jgi:hypothetical protein